MKYVLSRLLILSSLAALAIAQVHGQAGNSAITGNVNDATGAALPNVEVAIVNENTGEQRSNTHAMNAGMYRVNSLLPGSYRIEAGLRDSTS